MKSNTTTARLALLLWIVSCGACSSEAPGDTPDAADASASDAAAEDAPASDAAADAPGSACPTAPGPKMVWIPWPAQKGGGYCIDSTEVTREQYTAFVAANVAPTTQEPKCAWNTTFVPDSECIKHVLGTPSPNLPQTCVDWCDSQAFCRWAGKRLCGGTSEKINEASTSEWYNACSAGGTKLRPYGDEHKPYCNVRYSTGGSMVLLDVGMNPSCEGGFPGILDMLGNALEWTGECADLSPEGPACWLRGSDVQGNWPNEIEETNRRDNPTCLELELPLYKPNGASIGSHGSFRCCADEVK